MALWKSGVRVPSGPQAEPSATYSWKGVKVAKHKRKVWDELLELGRRMLRELDDLLDPKAQSPREPVRVPVPADKGRNRHENP